MLFVAITCFVSRTDAAILFLKGSDDPLHVRTIRESDTTVVVGVPQADGTFSERIIERRNIDDFIRTVSPERLAALDPAQPSLYRDYAEELAEKKVDPDARAAAIRLYLIAAHLDPKNLGRSSLLGMTSLARSAGEERKFRAMVYLLDPKHDRAVLKEGAAAGDDATAATEGRDGLLAALRLLRQGNRRVAERMADRPSVVAAFSKYRGFSREEFLAACGAADNLDPATLARVIRFELVVSGASPPRAEPDKTAGGGWSAILNADGAKPAPALKLKTLTEFDPEQTVYRGGKWAKPSP